MLPVLICIRRNSTYCDSGSD